MKIFFDLADYPKYDWGKMFTDAINCVIASGKINKIIIVVPVKAVYTTVDGILGSIGWQKKGQQYMHYNINLIIILCIPNSCIPSPSDAIFYFDLSSKQIFLFEDKISMDNLLEISIKDSADINLWGQTFEVKNVKNRAKDFNQLATTHKCQQAIDQLSKLINLSNKFSFHTSDEDLVKTYLLALHGLEPNPVNADSLFTYAMYKHNWPYHMAEQMREWMQRLNNGKTFKGGDRNKARWKTLYNRW